MRSRSGDDSTSAVPGSAAALVLVAIDVVTRITDAAGGCGDSGQAQRARPLQSGRSDGGEMSKSARAGTRSGKGQNGVPVIIGVPYDENSSYLRGPAEAPAKIREAFRCDASNLWSETGVDLGVEGRFADAGDLEPSGDKAFARIEAAVRGEVAAGRRPVCLGGDHSVTYPILRGFGKKFRDLTIVHFDAHPDLYDVFEGS